MRYQIAILSLVFLSACSQITQNTMINDSLSINVQCKGNANCHFDGNDIFLEILIKNNQPFDIGFPLAYLQKKGPIVKLIDTESRAETFLKTNLADPSLRKIFTKISPNKSISLEWVITSSELKQFRGDNVDLTAEVAISTPIQVTKDNSTLEFQGTSRIRIVGHDRSH